MPRIVRGKTGAGDPPSPSPAPAPASPAPGAAPRSRPLVPPRAPSSAKTRNKVLFTVADGKIEWDKMTSESRKAFEEMFRDPAFLREFGLTGKENFSPEQMKAIYDGISAIYQTVLGFFQAWPPQALALLAYTPEQKEMLAGPTAKLADRFAPKLLRDNQELIIWASIFGAVTQKNFLAALAEADKEKKKKQQLPPGAAPRGPVRVAPPNPSPADRPAPVMEVPFMPPPAPTYEGESLG